ncbi:hypothetical protein [Streptomyces pinistramenti]|uniref:hypothetical protein n=1 Tax=Streptomyces pinistramenti TaxID=2884812 RepID=UPI001D082EB4|nr:hypothetical protein [Streptomyces pinistramenti]MCB5910402.1 hypothetical protein [Streptomyces pinistramenti]
MTIVIDAKNETKRAIDDLDGRLGQLDRDLREAFTGEIRDLHTTHLSDLKASQQETRSSAYNAGKRAGEAVTAVTALRNEVAQLHSGLGELRDDFREVLALLRAATALEAAGSVVGPVPAAAAGADSGAELAALPGQRPAPQEESAPATQGASTSVGAMATNEQAETVQAVEGISAAAEDNLSSEETKDQPEGDAPEDENLVASRAALDADNSRSQDDPLAGEPVALSAAGRVWAIMRAGSVASATLVCHRDTWEFIAAHVGSHPHFRTPALEEREGGLVAAVLSGRSLVAMILALYQVTEAHRTTDDNVEDLAAFADWAMACQVYNATAEVLREAREVEGDPVVVTIDNRIPARP